jgi:pyruvyltransferase
VNFGDLITPLLLKHYGLVPFLRMPEEAAVVSTGSILHLLPEDYAGIILGSGLINEQSRRFARARVFSVRGTLTRDCLGLPVGTPLGDPGLLASIVFERRPAIRYALGIIPHFVDAEDERILRICQGASEDVRLIDVKRPPEQVFADIRSCERIVSSSLHGLVVADAFRIPCGWMVLSDKVLGHGFKFRDYHSALGIQRTPLTLFGTEGIAELGAITSAPSVDRLAEVQQSIDGSFRELRRVLG